ncbi:MAG TPA: multidrug transporter [Pseudomonas sp.]|nr:multidrug transporter [Pseudomonas sp.]MBB51853.1 multidrug transporter [Pseudomonadales bacterium]MBB52344.1 multidrug transporter [Pseudomonadales bacterium]HCA24269.1 multidrug transporter [Pseudomonas sp.]|tara:strand:+ start:9932 stop:11329 length:1398 start_codon:yes stop_codon:yes gene_type:complete
MPRLFPLLALGLAISGCSLAPEYQRPAAPIPDQWQLDSANQPDAQQQQDWQQFVIDPGQRALVEQALNNNRSLRQTLLDMEAARAQYGIQRADRLPSISLDGSGQRQRLPADSTPSGQAETSSQYQVGLGLAAFELDLFGRIRNLSEAALQDYLASEQALQSTRISLIADVVATSVQRDGALRQLAIARDTLETRTANLRMIEQQRTLGAADELDYQQALAEQQSVLAQIEQLDRTLRQHTNALRLLTGQAQLNALPGASPEPARLAELAPGAPSSLLNGRPDIRAAEHRLQARQANIGAARAAFFPQITLTGALGNTSSDLGDLFNSGQSSWSFSPQLTLPLFTGGRNQAGLDLAIARRDAAVAAYEERIQVAFREVSDALAAQDTLNRELNARSQQAAANTRAAELAQTRYQAGATDYFRVLQAQQDQLQSQQQREQAHTQQQLASTQLYRALGGSWVSAVSD